MFVVEGGHRLAGTISVAGNKNAALPILAATLLTDQPVTLHNLPRIGDVETMLALLEQVGAQITEHGRNDVTIHAAHIRTTDLDPGLCRKIRASILLAGPLVSRHGQVRLTEPGGDSIGRRRIDTHFLALEALGARVTTSRDNTVSVRARELHARAQPGEIGVVETREIELRLAVVRQSRTGARPRVGPAVFGHLGRRVALGPLRHLPAPEPGEVVSVPLQQIEKRGVIEYGRRLRARFQAVAGVLEILPDVGAGEINGARTSIRAARAVGEVVRIRRVRTQRTRRTGGFRGATRGHCQGCDGHEQRQAEAVFAGEPHANRRQRVAPYFLYSINSAGPGQLISSMWPWNVEKTLIAFAPGFRRVSGTSSAS